MPGRDSSGPRGMGPYTGRGMGNCSPATRNANFYGRGLRRRYYVNDNSNESLADEKKALEERLKIINSELDK
ncbi:MAG: DUF5320 domain-containing protein [Tenericutes bacterium]|nr:DUF5320 domain-containing protein [Mycoplasmatota bacterium]